MPSGNLHSNRDIQRTTRVKYTGGLKAVSVTDKKTKKENKASR